MKKIYILSALLLLAVLAYFAVEKGWLSGSRPDLKDFAVKDTTAIDRIFMADRQNHHILLEKKGDTWWVNGKYEAHPGWFNQLINTIARVQVKSPVQASFRSSVIKSLATSHVKVEIYTHGEKVKTYFVGGPTQDMKGTYMLIEGASEPYICEIPGFDGYLTPRYHVDETAWRSRKLIQYLPEKMNHIQITYPQEKGWDFELKGPLENPSIHTPSGPLMNGDTTRMKYYMGLFRELYAEGFGSMIPGLNIDSIKQTKPWCKLVIAADGKETTLTIYRKGVDERSRQQFTDDGQPANYDTERYYAFLNNDPELYVVQDYVFGKVFSKAADFVKR